MVGKRLLIRYNVHGYIGYELHDVHMVWGKGHLTSVTRQALCETLFRNLQLVSELEL